ncbi:MAG: NAD(P)/FAD-dependent oxidoreductase [Gammaproteobacteria bacterium]|nr:NAD(P)/FAD-dependent oxidoreductase [Gammaproteobacteria bacterium]
MSQQDRYDVIIIGAGLSGMYQLKLLRELGLSVHAVDAAGDVGGVWYWNRYPGARVDSESFTYGYSFSDDIVAGWDWNEMYAGQPENHRYLRFCAEQMDVRKDITFNARVTRMTFDEAASDWTLEFADGSRRCARFVVAATGPLSAPQWPAIEGLGTFEGEAYHTAVWPRDANGSDPAPVKFDGKRIAVIGTGASGVQTIQELAKSTAEIYVFQRTPNWCMPLGNKRLTDEDKRDIKARQKKIFADCMTTFSGFDYGFVDGKATEADPEEREAFFEKLYWQAGFGLWLGNYSDILFDQRANELVSDFVARKVRQRVKDPAIAEKLIPKDHGFGTRRVPLETNYYEAYNQPNVHLIDAKADPIQQINSAGLRTASRQYDLDMIIYATGFDAVRGALDRIDIRGRGGRSLKDKWQEGPVTYLGLQYAGFPNLLALVGPQSGATFCNIPRCAEPQIRWVTDLLKHMKEHGLKSVEATEQAETEWTDHVAELVSHMLFATAKNGWFFGGNTPGRKVSARTFVAYTGGNPAYRERCNAVAANGYTGFILK